VNQAPSRNEPWFSALDCFRWRSTTEFSVSLAVGRDKRQEFGTFGLGGAARITCCPTTFRREKPVFFPFLKFQCAGSFLLGLRLLCSVALGTSERVNVIEFAVCHGSCAETARPITSIMLHCPQLHSRRFTCRLLQALQSLGARQGDEADIK
jgi:hypothetical protein